MRGDVNHTAFEPPRQTAARISGRTTRLGSKSVMTFLAGAISAVMVGKVVPLSSRHYTPVDAAPYREQSPSDRTDCEQQTWPHWDDGCRAIMLRNHTIQPVRVISTGRIASPSLAGGPSPLEIT